MHACTHAYIHTYTSIYIYIDVYIYICIHTTYMYVYTCMHTSAAHTTRRSGAAPKGYPVGSESHAFVTGLFGAPTFLRILAHTSE